MTREELCAKKEEALAVFDTAGKVTYCDVYGSGHINDTFLVVCEVPEGQRKYILQRMNHEIFTEPEALMRNVEKVTGFLAKAIAEYGGDPARETLQVVKTKAGEPFYKDSIGSYWRMYDFVEDTISYDAVKNPGDFYQSAYTFGSFQKLLSGFDASVLVETIPDFHNTPKRYEKFLKVVEQDVCHRAEEVKEEIEFFLAHEADMKICQEKLKNGELPLRVTHNDTKLNNILLDKETGKGLCVIDLDTVMPGLSIFDFGDSIRFGANTAAEDETDLTKVSLDLELYGLYAKGYLEGCGGRLTEEEVKMMPYGAKNMTLECGMRFLTDYLEGDVYFKIHREKHNLDRCRTQIALVKDMEAKWENMIELTMEAAK